MAERERFDGVVGSCVNVALEDRYVYGEWLGPLKLLPQFSWDWDLVSWIMHVVCPGKELTLTQTDWVCFNKETLTKAYLLAACQHSLNYPSFLFRYLQRHVRSLVYLPLHTICTAKAAFEWYSNVTLDRYFVLYAERALKGIWYS